MQTKEETTATHEAGHALVGCLLNNIEVVKASILPDLGFEGHVALRPYNSFAGQRDLFLVLAGGMAAEQLATGEFNAMGCRADLQGMRKIFAESSGQMFEERHQYSPTFSPYLEPGEAHAFESALTQARELIAKNLGLYMQIYTRLLHRKVITKVEFVGLRKPVKWMLDPTSSLVQLST